VTEEAECSRGRQRTIGDASRGTGGSRGAHDSEGSAGSRVPRSPAASTLGSAWGLAVAWSAPPRHAQSPSRWPQGRPLGGAHSPRRS